MNILETVKGNPVISTLLAIGVVGGSVTGALSSFDVFDNLVVTHAELDEHASELHAGAQEAIDKLDTWNQCDRLERRLDVLDDRLWRLEQADDPDEDAIRDLENDIEKVERDFEARNCAEVLS